MTEVEKTRKEPVVDKTAGAEAIFWRVALSDEFMGPDLVRMLHHYVRLKVYSEKGREQVATTQIEYGDKVRIIDISGRTIKPDGSILEMKKDAVFRRDAVRVGGRKVRNVSFELPGVEPGVIVEYKWKEYRGDPRIFYARLQFQREVPVEKVTYYIKPLGRDYGVEMSFRAFNCKPTGPAPDRDGVPMVTLENVPAFKEEPMMPGHAAVRPWGLIFYHNGSKREPDKYWIDVGKRVYNRALKPALRSNDDVREATTKAVGGATTETDKFLALIRYARANIRDFSSNTVTEAERAKIIKQRPKDSLRTAGDILKSGIANSDELNLVVASMALQAGLEVRPVLVSDRADMDFHPALLEDYFLSSVDLALNVGGEWKVYDVSMRRLPAGMLSWREQGAQALLCDSKQPRFIPVPPSEPEHSLSRRVARLRLSEQGDIEGDVTQEYTGHEAAEQRALFDGETDERRQELVKEQVTERLPKAEVSAVVVNNQDDPEKPLQVNYHIKLDGYAQRTGRRILFAPLFFQKGSTPLFTAAERKYRIDFRHALVEEDSVELDLPAGFSLENAANPGGIDFGKVGSYGLTLAAGGTKFTAVRSLRFGAGGLLLFLPDMYPNIKATFDEVHRRDNTVFSLVSGASPASK